MSGQKQLVMGFLMTLRVFSPFVTYTQLTAPSSRAHRDIFLHMVSPHPGTYTEKDTTRGQYVVGQII